MPLMGEAAVELSECMPGEQPRAALGCCWAEGPRGLASEAECLGGVTTARSWGAGNNGCPAGDTSEAGGTRRAGGTSDGGTSNGGTGEGGRRAGGTSEVGAAGAGGSGTPMPSKSTCPSALPAAPGWATWAGAGRRPALKQSSMNSSEEQSTVVSAGLRASVLAALSRFCTSFLARTIAAGLDDKIGDVENLTSGPAGTASWSTRGARENHWVHAIVQVRNVPGQGEG